MTRYTLRLSAVICLSAASLDALAETVPKIPPESKVSCAQEHAVLRESASTQSANTAFNQAKLAYQDGHYDIAMRQFAVLANHGHAESARIALQMFRYGLSLYGKQCEAPPTQRGQWATTAARAACTPDA